MARVTHSINLLRKKEKQFVDVLLDWTFEYGRYVILLTEAVALCAFVYRFSLDRQIIDLNDSIKSKQRIVALLQNNEDKFRNLQERLSEEKKLTAKAGSASKLLTFTITNAPSDFTVSKLSVDKNTLHLQADVTKPTSITNFVEKLKNYKAVSSVSIDKIQNKPSNSVITVDISANLKP